MQKIVIQDSSANYDEDAKIANSSETVEFSYVQEDDEVFIAIKVGDDEHYITLSFDRSQFIEAVTKSLTEPEDA
jgi:hypothetical protein